MLVSNKGGGVTKTYILYCKMNTTEYSGDFASALEDIHGPTLLQITINSGQNTKNKQKHYSKALEITKAGMF